MNPRQVGKVSVTQMRKEDGTKANAPGNTRDICGSDKMFARYFHVVIHLIILLTAVTKTM